MMLSGRAEGATLDGAPVALAAQRRQRTAVLAAIAAAAVALFVVTHFVTRAYEGYRGSLAEQWFDAAQRELALNHAAAAVDAYRTALTYDPENSDYTLRLAEALAQAGRRDQAEQYLLRLWQEEPGSGRVNLDLARLAAGRHDERAALGYYHGAVYGGWSGQGQQMRRAARLELVDFLIAQNAMTQARAELIGVTADLPNDAGARVGVAERFLRAGDNENGLLMYREAIRMGARSGAVFAGAGTAAFHAGDYRAAVEYLSKAAAAGQDGPVKSMEETARAVLELDPYARGLSHLTRVVRVLRSVDVASARLQACSAAPARGAAPATQPVPPTPAGTAPPITPLPAAQLQQLADIKRILNRQPAAVTGEQLDAASEIVFQVEQNAAACPNPTPSDAALTLIGRARQAQTP